MNSQTGGAVCPSLARYAVKEKHDRNVAELEKKYANDGLAYNHAFVHEMLRFVKEANEVEDMLSKSFRGLIK